MILYDGALGSYYRSLYPDDRSRLEELNLTHPERILAIHREYLAAGARRIKSNTFACLPSVLDQSRDQIARLVDAAWALGQQALADYPDAQLVADIGPAPFDALHSEETSSRNAADYLWLAEHFCMLGATEFLFETQDQLAPLLPACRHIIERQPDATITVSFSSNMGGYTRSGGQLADLLQAAEQEPSIRYTGLNCDLGPTHLGQIARDHSYFPKLAYFSPNSGLPKRDLGRGRSEADARYYARTCGIAWSHGLDQLSGCCGTNPHDIAELHKLYSHAEPGSRLSAPRPRPRPDHHPHPGQNPRLASFSDHPRSPGNKQTWFQRLQAGERILAIEYDTPTTHHTEAYLRGVRELRDAGCDLLTIADNPAGRTRMDSTLMAARITAELGLEVLPHFTCRDRNLTAIHSQLLALAGSGVHQVLAVTGDPLPLEDRNRVQSVFDVNSQSLLHTIRTLNNDLDEPFILAAALNVNAPRFHSELKRAERKQAAGAQVFLTQPVFTEAAKHNLAQAHSHFRGSAYILAGIMPLVSHKNALYMQYEMSGIEIPTEIIDRYQGLDRSSSEALALELSRETIEAVQHCCDGFYLMTPFQRTHLTATLCREWQAAQR